MAFLRGFCGDTLPRNLAVVTMGGFAVRARWAAHWHVWTVYLGTEKREASKQLNPDRGYTPPVESHTLMEGSCNYTACIFTYSPSWIAHAYVLDRAAVCVPDRMIPPGLAAGCIGHSPFRTIGRSTFLPARWWQGKTCESNPIESIERTSYFGFISSHRIIENANAGVLLSHVWRLRSWNDGRADYRNVRRELNGGEYLLLFFRRFSR